MAPTYLEAAQTPLGCAAKREAAKDADHQADVTRAGNTFVPCVFESHGTMGARGRDWFRGLIDAADVLDDAGDPLIGDAMVWAKARLSDRWQQRFAVALQRGNAGIILSGARRARDRLGTRVRMRHESSLDVG